MKSTLLLPGINIQQPWSEMIMGGIKTIELRKYPLPDKFYGKLMWLIETPGKVGKFKARVIGIVSFKYSVRYSSVENYRRDRDKHRVFGFSPHLWCGVGPMFAWPIKCAKTIRPFPAKNMSRGMVYSSPYKHEVNYE